MSPLSSWRQWRSRAVLGVSAVALLSIATSASSRESDVDVDHQGTASPIKHVIVLMGENRSFDHVFATYVPKSHDTVKNLLSEGIVNADGTPGPNFAKAAQFQEVPPFNTKYFISLNKHQKAPYAILPGPTLNFAPTSPFFPPGTPDAPRRGRALARCRRLESPHHRRRHRLRPDLRAAGSRHARRQLQYSAERTLPAARRRPSL